jgi:hypothetical protein
VVADGAPDGAGAGAVLYFAARRVLVKTYAFLGWVDERRARVRGADAKRRLGDAMTGFRRGPA